MKIIYISDSIIPSRFANSIHVMKMCNALSKKCDTELFAVDGKFDGDPNQVYGTDGSFKINFFQKNNTKLSSLKYIFHIFQRIKIKTNVYLYGRHLNTLLILNFKNLPIIYESHGLPNTFVKYYSELILFKSKNFKKLIVISAILKNDYMQSYPFLDEKDIIVAHDAADAPKVPFLKNVVNEDKINVGYVGHLYRGRGIELIIELAQKFPNINFHIIGGMEQDILLWKNKSKHFSNIVFYGHLLHSELENFFYKFDIVLAPYQKGINQSDNKSDTSRWMSPMKIFEYMSYKKAIICSDIPVLREVLNENNCILVSPSDIDEWVNAIKELMNENKRNRLADQAYFDFTNKHTWDKRAELILDGIVS